MARVREDMMSDKAGQFQREAQEMNAKEAERLKRLKETGITGAIPDQQDYKPSTPVA